MITVLAGGVGAARFLRGLAQVVEPSEITAVVNVGDDLQVHGLHVAPDLDSITYHLAGVVHPGQEWGRADESFVVASVLERLGRPTWFTLGDRDLGVHLHRTARLAEGATLSQVTSEIAHAFRVQVRLLPATDDPVQTRIHTATGDDLHFQEYWVRDRAEHDVVLVELRGREAARPAPGVVEAIVDADVVIVAPSNPVVSIGTVLDVPGIREAVRTTPAPVVGVSPIVGGSVVRGMADRLLPAIDVDVTALGVAAHYAAWLDGWVLDERDAAEIDAVTALGLRAVATNTMMDDPAVAAALASTCLDLARALGDGRERTDG